tara:strand:+ start:247 stop:462 length:216 start_codon:yes stop_codon:yes gene_type:complete
MTEKKYLKWDWEKEMETLILILLNGDEEGKAFAQKELMELAKQLDKHNIFKDEQSEEYNEKYGGDPYLQTK